MRSYASITVIASAFFVMILAIMLNSPQLFYMGTAMIATMGASRLQSWLSVRGLRFERIAPESAHVGDEVEVEITVWSERKIMRPLISVIDHLPQRLLSVARTRSLPIAPAYDLPVRTQYSFRPLRRGSYRWDKLTVVGTDALGLVTMTKAYQTAPAQLTVLPTPIPVSVELPKGSGWGFAETEHGSVKGAGIEPRGIRGYVSGDPLRHVHWRSSARTGQLLVKEFEAGAQAPAVFVIQRTSGTVIGVEPFTSFEIMCGHLAYLSERLLRQGARVDFPNLEPSRSRADTYERLQEILRLLASVEADSPDSVSKHFREAVANAETGSIVYIMVGIADPALSAEIAALRWGGIRVAVLLYDAGAFVPEGKKLSGPSAVDAGYIAQLEASGATPVIMPLEGLTPSRHRKQQQESTKKEKARAW
jgi:uncharacterized protein (DUF58 family)